MVGAEWDTFGIRSQSRQNNHYFMQQDSKLKEKVTPYLKLVTAIKPDLPSLTVYTALVHHSYFVGRVLVKR